MVKPSPKPPGEHNKLESKTLHKLGMLVKLCAARRIANVTGAAGKAFSYPKAGSWMSSPLEESLFCETK